MISRRRIILLHGQLGYLPYMQLYSLEVPNHWLRDFFYAKASLTLLLSNDALSYYTNLSTVGFSQSPYINAQLAHANYNLESKYCATHTHTHTQNTYLLLYRMSFSS